MFKMLRNRRGAALVEYALLIAGVALVSAAAVSVFGHKTTDLVAATASIMPGAHDDDNAPIVSGKLIETAPNADGDITLDVAGITDNSNNFRLGDNLLGAGNGEQLTDLVVEPN